MAKVGIVVGSLRKESFSRKIAHNVTNMFPASCTTEMIEVDNLPLYREEYDDNPPAEYTAFRSKIKSCDAILFVTPEYNRSIPGVLKNAIDIASRPYGQSVWAGKPAAIISQSIDGLGGFDQPPSTSSTDILDMPTLRQPEVYLSNSPSFLDEKGQITNQDTIRYLQSFVDAFVAHIKKYQAETVPV